MQSSWPVASFSSQMLRTGFLRQRPHSFVGWCSDVSRERGPAEPRNNAADLHLPSAYGECVAWMESGRDPVHSSDKPRDFIDR